MAGKTFNVLFLCTGNSARSIMAETLLNAMGKGRFKAFSAGSHATGKVNSLALELIEKNRLPTEGLRSKNWDEFAGPGAPEMQFVFTKAYSQLANRISIFLNLPLDKLDRLALQKKLDEIGNT